MTSLFHCLLLCCVVTASTGALADRQLDDPRRRELIDAHNRWRSAVGVGPLRWADDLATGARQWADRLARERNCRMQHSPAELRQQTGENLFWASPRRWSDGRVELQPLSGAQVVDSWGQERDDYQPARNTCRAGRVCGHYTQVVWRDTREVGCAMQQCDDRSQVWVCRYRPAGNWVGQRPY